MAVRDVRWPARAPRLSGHGAKTSPTIAGDTRLA